MLHLTRAQARRFLLRYQGLLGEHRFAGKAGALAYVRQAGCIQFDPVDVCGRNAELTLQSRVKGFSKATLETLLYRDRALVDYPDKNLSIWPRKDWPYFARYRQAARLCGESFEGLHALEDFARGYVSEHGPVSADELPLDGEIHWHSAIHWSGNWHGVSRASRSVLEQLYATGEMVIHHKCGARKVYDLAERNLPRELLAAPDPCPEMEAHLRWRVLRRVGAVGLMWNRPSDAWLGIQGLDAQERTAAFQALLREGLLTMVQVEGWREPFFCRTTELPLLLETLRQERWRPRCEVLAPLDCLLWDRRLIRAFFDFDYAWEIYTPAVKRKYGPYVLPLLYGEGFAGRVEAVADRKAGVLTVRNLWLEPGICPGKQMERAMASCFKRLMRLNHCQRLEGVFSDAGC